MLPGFRFLFTAIVLSTSILVFGLGAAALLRAAHEEFATLPSRRAPPQPMFARQNDDQPPTLALLRIDPPAPEKPVENVPATIPEAVTEVAAQTAQTLDGAGPAEPEKLAALKPADPVQAEPAKPEASAMETRVETPAAPVPAAETEAPVTDAEAKLAAIPETSEPVAAAPPPPLAPDIHSFEGNATAAKIATLGDPAVVVDEKTAAKATEAKTPEAKTPEAKTTEAKPAQSAARKRARERRRIAARRARLAREAALTLQQQQPNPFATFPLTGATR
jgi:hypothetical protein